MYQLEMSTVLGERKKELTTALIELLRVLNEFVLWRHQEDDYCGIARFFTGGLCATYDLVIPLLFGKLSH